MIIGIIFTSVGAFILALTLGLNLLLHEGALFMILPTSFCQGSSQYPLGMTIDIFEYQGKYEYDPSSVRYEILPGEQELMDNKPVEPSQLHIISVICPNCGASYKKAADYAEKCPYCGSYQNT